MSLTRLSWEFWLRSSHRLSSLLRRFDFSSHVKRLTVEVWVLHPVSTLQLAWAHHKKQTNNYCFEGEKCAIFLAVSSLICLLTLLLWPHKPLSTSNVNAQFSSFTAIIVCLLFGELLWVTLGKLEARSTSKTSRTKQLYALQGCL